MERRATGPDNPHRAPCPGRRACLASARQPRGSAAERPGLSAAPAVQSARRGLRHDQLWRGRGAEARPRAHAHRRQVGWREFLRPQNPGRDDHHDIAGPDGWTSFLRRSIAGNGIRFSPGNPCELRRSSSLIRPPADWTHHHACEASFQPSDSRTPATLDH